MSEKYCGKQKYNGFHFCGEIEMGSEIPRQCDECEKASTPELTQAAQIKLLREALEQQLIEGHKFVGTDDGCFDDKWKLIARKALAATEGE